MPTAAPPRPDQPVPVPLVARLGAALAERGVAYCQWKGHGKRERWESGRGDIDLLVARADWPAFSEVLADLGFKLALPAPGREAAGISHFFALDERTGKLVHVHAYTRLVLGLPWRTHYRLPLERALLDGSAQEDVFRAPSAELEAIVLVLRLTLRYGPLDALRGRTPGWVLGALPELDRLEERASPAAVAAALRRHLPEVSPSVFERCRDSLRPSTSPVRRLAARRALVSSLRAHAARPPMFAFAERGFERLGSGGGHRLAGGGAVVALLGGDGSGKSTCAEALRAWLAPALAVLHVHLGRPPRSLATLAVGGVLKLAKLVGGGKAKNAVAHLELLRCCATARDRARLYRRARRFATAGGIAICERYPTRENWALAGPSESQGVAIAAVSPLAGALRRWERRCYERITAPDLTFVLRLDGATAVARKPGEPADYVRARAKLTDQADWARVGACLVDASQPLPQVVAAIKTQLWRTL
jgi:thymidylate kinase